MRAPAVLVAVLGLTTLAGAGGPAFSAAAADGGGAGSTVSGAGGAVDAFVGRRGRDRFVAGRGDELVGGFSPRGGGGFGAGLGADVSLLGPGHDHAIFSGPGADLVRGGPGRDLIDGEGGRDELLGGPGADVINTSSFDRVDPNGSPEYFSQGSPYLPPTHTFAAEGRPATQADSRLEPLSPAVAGHAATG